VSVKETSLFIPSKPNTTREIPEFSIAWTDSSGIQRDGHVESKIDQSVEGMLDYSDINLELHASLPSWSTRQYVESSSDHSKGKSFVLLFGACLWKERANSWWTERDLQHCLELHRSDGVLPLNELDGNFCLISYDRLSQTLWLATDFWATAGFYYGSRGSLTIASNRAAVVADRIHAQIDAMGYLSLLRSTVPAAGSSLFRGVSRISMGQALYFTNSASNARVVETGPIYKEPENWSFRDTLERSRVALSSTIANCVSREQTIVDLTSGNDTRVIAAALSHRSDLTKQLIFRVVGSSGSHDVEVANQIASHFNWRCNANVAISGALTAENAPKVALAADGSFSLDLIANRLFFESTSWPDAQHLVGGMAGELFRNWIWQQELFRMGLTTAINYPALLRHRVPRDHAVDVSSITSGRLSNREHDQWLIGSLRILDQRYPSALNTSKLELYYIQRLMHRTPWWPLASRLITILPFLWSSVTDVSLRIPWRQKRTRRLVTTLVEEFDSWIATLATDRGAPFRPLRMGTAMAYGRYLLSYNRDVIRRHYLERTPAPLQVETTGNSKRADLAPELAELLPGSRISLHEDYGLADEVKCGAGSRLSHSRRAEFLTTLQIELLCRNYPGIRRELQY
jgi:hypothetical protein